MVRGEHARTERGSSQVLSSLPGLLSSAAGTLVIQGLATHHCPCPASHALGRREGVYGPSPVLLKEGARTASVNKGLGERKHPG